MDMSQPLTDEELEELGEFLMSDLTGAAAMDLSMVDGFLTALAVGPRNLPPSQWMPLIWGGEMNWQSKEQAEHFMGLIFRHANDILLYLRSQPDSFEPLLYEREHEGSQIPIIDEWCTGFIRGMALDEDHWRSFIESEAGSDVLYPIMLYGTEAGWETLMNNPGLVEQHAEFAASLGDRVLAIMAWWLPQRHAQTSTPAQETRKAQEAPVGRNAPCPCGSGKRFKQCCGSPRTLH